MENQTDRSLCPKVDQNQPLVQGYAKAPQIWFFATLDDYIIFYDYRSLRWSPFFS